MKALIQRVSVASVEVHGAVACETGRGFLVLVGVARGDTDSDADYLAHKVANLRVFEDDAGKMNLSLYDVKGEVLAVSQFTLLADTTRGHRPSFTGAAPPQEGERLYLAFAEALEAKGITVSRGVFGAHMHVSLINDGPVTVLIDSREKGPVRSQ